MNKILQTILISITLNLSVSAAWSQSCNSNITDTAPGSRYTDNGDGTITDLDTGLMWRQCSEGLSTTTTACDTGTLVTYKWQDALGQAESVNTSGGFAGYTDWRVPNARELASLQELKCYQPAINLVMFPDTVATSAEYWSSSPAGTVGYAWSVSFDYGNENKRDMTILKYVRLVRSTF